ncbi:SDR family oxidoreductase [Ochrobactrum sp. Q0168]|uniref:SDR family NAD(P)-dependent oxidoreductase n=1 Tax=Ochrobactrum sp. Q0168 TaxID=2793241 RepID=UPI0018EC89E7|nr:SDR family oxidoreductase [Ochrobactrum sp. Q0168]
MSISLSLDGKVAIITGAGSGIGAASAKIMAAAGAKLVLVDMNQDALAAMKETIRTEHQGVSVMTAQANVTDQNAVIAYISEAHKRFGRIDVLFNNAGIEGTVKDIIDYPDDVYDQVMAVNSRGVWLNLKYCGQIMCRQGGGSIINMGSVSSLIGANGFGAYTAAKHAVHGITRNAAVEMAPFAVRVNAICPGPIDTPLQDRVIGEIGSNDKYADSLAGKSVRQVTELNIPFGRLGRPEEVASVVAFLASDMSSYITGAAIPIDGGLVAK